jgi:hypothetical protein
MIDPNNAERAERCVKALLRLKRHEVPPPGYFDELLKAVQERQRSEMLGRPLFQLILDRVTAAFRVEELPVGAYAALMAALLVGGVTVINWGLPDRPVNQSASAVPETATNVSGEFRGGSGLNVSPVAAMQGLGQPSGYGSGRPLTANDVAALSAAARVAGAFAVQSGGNGSFVITFSTPREEQSTGVTGLLNPLPTHLPSLGWPGNSGSLEQRPVPVPGADGVLRHVLDLQPAGYDVTEKVRF